MYTPQLDGLVGTILGFGGKGGGPFPPEFRVALEMWI